MAIPVYINLLVGIWSVRRLFPLKHILWPILFSSIGFCVLVSLGVWQLQRLTWKEQLITQIQAQQELQLIEITPENQSVFRRIYAVGRFNYGQELRLIGKTVDQQVGYYVFTPLTLKEGRTIYVNRGWVPQTIADTAISRPLGNIRVEGMLREKMSRNTFTPANQYDNRDIFTFDPEEIAATYPDQTLLPYYIDASQISPPSEYPNIKPLGVHLRNHHLVYALTWFALAGGLAIVCFLFIRNKRNNH
jgi:surfeit locus 1 family protein